MIEVEIVQHLDVHPGPQTGTRIGFATVGSSLIPPGHNSVFAPRETSVAVLGDHHNEGVGQSASEAIGGAVAGAYPSGVLPGGPFPFHVEGLSHGGNSWPRSEQHTSELQS